MMGRLMSIRLVTFDLDGVLQNNPFGGYVLPTLARIISPYLRRDHRHLYQQYPGVSPGPDEIDLPGLDSKGREVIAAIYAEAASCIVGGPLRDAYDWDAAAISVARAVGCHQPIDVVELVREGCRQGHISALPGAAETLQELSDSGITLVAVSNGFTRYQRPVLEALGLYSYFAATVSPEETGTAKPDPRIFRAAQVAAGASTTGATFHVGDTLIHDVLGAKAAGIGVVWMYPELPADIATHAPWQRSQHPRLVSLLADRAAGEFAASLYDFTPEQLIPDAVVHSLYELPATLRELAIMAEGWSPLA
jgi:putative hydrolase of the HAD superfamily